NPSGTGKPAHTSSPRLAPLPPAIERSAARTSRSARISGELIGGPGCGGRSGAFVSAGGWPLLLDPLQRRSLAVRVVRGLTPCVEPVQALLRLARRSRVLRMHVQEIGAAVDLRRAHLQQVRELRLDAALVNELL